YAPGRLAPDGSLDNRQRGEENTDLGRSVGQNIVATLALPKKQTAPHKHDKKGQVGDQDARDVQIHDALRISLIGVRRSHHESPVESENYKKQRQRAEDSRCFPCLCCHGLCCCPTQPSAKLLTRNLTPETRFHASTIHSKIRYPAVTKITSKVI